MKAFVEVLLVIVSVSFVAIFAHGQVWMSEWRPVNPTGFTVSWTRKAGGLTVKFAKRGSERRLLLLETSSPSITKAKSVVIRFRLKLIKGKIQRLAVLAFGRSGEVWFKVSYPISFGNEEVEWVMPLVGFQTAGFSSNVADFDPTKISRLQVGLVLDGACEGIWEVKDIFLSTEPFRPNRPLIVPITPEIQTLLAHDPAAKAKTGIVKEGNKLIWRTEFTIPGGRHMYVLPILPIPDTDLTGYSSLQLTYRARLPAGIKFLLVTLVEKDGSNYYTDWLAAPTEEWRTLTIPLSEFRLGGWSQDENGKLDLDQIESIIVGMHGTTSEREGSGTIWVSSIAFIP